MANKIKENLKLINEKFQFSGGSGGMQSCRDCDSMIDLILNQTLIMQVQNWKLVEILIDNQDKP